MSEPVLTPAEADAGFTTGGAMHESQPSAPDTPQLSPDASPEEVFKSFTQLPAQPQPEPEPAAPPAAKPAKVDAVLPDKGAEGDIPEQFISGAKKEAPAEDPELTRILSERPKGPIKHDHFETLQKAANTKIEALTKALTEREAAYAEAIKKSGQPPEEITKQLQQLAQERDEFSERLLRHDAKSHPKFQKEFVARQEAITERLNQRGKELGVSEEVLDAALRSSAKRRYDMVEELEITPTAKGALINLMEQYDDVQSQSNAFLSQSKEQLSAWQAEQKRIAQEQDRLRSEHEDLTFNSAVEDMRKSFAPFQRVEGNEAWNRQAEALEQEAKKYFNGQVPLRAVADVVLKGLGARVIEEKILPRLRKEITDLRSENNRLKTGQPAANGTAPHKTGQQPDDSHLSPEERAAATFRRFTSMASNDGFRQ